MHIQRSHARGRRTAVAAACLLIPAVAPATPAEAHALGFFGRHSHAHSAARVLDLVNEERWRAGCGPLVLDRRLSESARRHSGDMAYWHHISHRGSDGTAPVDRIRRTGFRAKAWGENVASGYRTADQVMDAWMASPGHRENILNCRYKRMGIAHAEPGDYWTQDFAAPR
ncbi:CAP domain-containing protein [Streptacidiphilus griseoplanus]|uniref:CAP domain-containing protein n=1 Tax=Peterkaempfera griseoplana TaxID=66896 RepID=UPI000A7355F8|nr:CAP domain-containing protein [Peterkaempfera griseoplana]